MPCSNPVITSLTVTDFKNQFFRGFNYLPTYDNSATYNQGAIVYLPANGFFYACIANGTTGQTPPDDTYWTLQPNLSRNDYILDEDITEAYSEACITFNEALFGDDDELKKGYLYLSAHYLVKDFNAQGVESVGSQMVSSRSVGSVSESYSIPEWMLKDPNYSFYATTSYGQKYLNMILPNLAGNVVSVEGKTNA